MTDEYRICPVDETASFLKKNHYLGATKVGQIAFGQYVENEIVAVQVWKTPSSRNLPSDGSWLELCRWCITPDAGANAGSRQHRFATKWLRQNRTDVTTLVSYSDPSQGHTGALYRACNWYWAPTWHRLRPPPSGNGNWGTGIQSVKDRWIFNIKKDDRREEVLRVKDDAIVRKGVPTWHEFKAKQNS